MDKLPRHVAIIMDGNGRWAKKRLLPRTAGHKSGLKATRNVIQFCSDHDIKALTLFAFSSENWKRPKQEVGMLMDLFMTALQAEIKRLDKNKVCMKFIGDIAAFPDKLQKRIHESEQLLDKHNGLQLRIAVNYGGRWDIVQAARRLAEQVRAGEIQPADISEETFSQFISMHELPEPDLFIRTGGEQRISNFLLWQCAYTELYFTDVLWPDFNDDIMHDALNVFAGRQRRFGRTGEQLTTETSDA